jgi:threonylcarbamoyladenosine tRNA methylthiotransferase MtaB
LHDVIDSVRELLTQGAQEIVLTGVSLGAYGRDLDPPTDLAGLVGALLADTDVGRLRLSSMEPWDVDEALLRLWSNHRLCRQLHLPLQSGSDRILRLMGRRTTRDAYLRLVQLSREVEPDIALTTDIMVGFPGEDEAAYSETLSLVEHIGFSRLHVFPYSERPGTAARQLPGSVPMRVRRARARQVRALGKGLAAAYMERSVGKVLPVLWEQRLDEVAWRGLTDTYLEVRTMDARPLHNRVTPTHIVGTGTAHLVGEIAAEHSALQRSTGVAVVSHARLERS